MVKLKKTALLLAAIFFGSFSASAQFSKPEIKASAKKETEAAGKKSEEKVANLVGELNMMEETPMFNPTLLRTGIYHGEKKATEALQVPLNELPAYIEDGKNASHGKKAAETPSIFRSYTGFSDSKYTPPDNTVAVNNDGMVVSAMNSNLRIYRYSGQLAKVNSFADLFRAQFPQFKATYYDPRVIYDSGNDRFILVVLHGSKSDSSQIMVLFSKTSNPLDGWNFYALNGDALGKGQWTDYPNIGVSNNELYITGNLFSNQGYFEEAFIMQINKHDGYDAKALRYQTWSDLKSQSGADAFTLVPVPYGQQGNYGPGTYFVCNDLNNSRNVNLFDLTDDMEASNEKLERHSLTNPFSYSIPNYSSQRGSTDLLNAGDTRIKHAFFLNKTIHYVYTSKNSNNNSSIVYCRLNVENLSQDYRSLAQSGSNYNYPSIASLGSDENDQSVLIGFLRSSSTVYPEMRVVHCDDNFEFSTSVLVQDGKSYVNILNDNVERWGDYTGMARKYSKNSCVFAGSYGNNGNWSTRIAEIGLTSNKVGFEEDKTAIEENTTVFPNPVIEDFTVSFSLEKMSYITIQLYDIQGRKIETLFSGTERAGQKQFSFNKAALPAGVYTLYIRSAENTLTAKKVVVQ